MRDVAVFTVVHNEPKYLPFWLGWANKYFYKDNIYVLDHDTSDGSTDKLDVSVEKIHNELYFDHSWLVNQVQKKQKELLNRYEWVLFTEVDELVIPNPSKYRSFADFLLDGRINGGTHVYRTNGHEIIQHETEPSFNFNGSLFGQRHYWFPSIGYSKPLLASSPQNYVAGFHLLNPAESTPEISPDLFLAHLCMVDHDYFMQRHEWKAKQKFKDDGGLGIQHRWNSEQCQTDWNNKLKYAQLIPEMFYKTI